MKILIDSRESDLWVYFEGKDSSITREQLLIGDCHILNDENEVKMVIERKTLADLASSIHDGRWSEQKYRALSEYQGKLFYIIEIEDFSQIFNYQPWGNITGDAILSATTNLWVNHNIPFIYLQGTEQTAKYIYKLCNQIEKEKKITDIENEYAKYLIKSILPKRRENMTREHYFLFCLQGIPGISNKTATNIRIIFNTFIEFIDYIRENDTETFGKKYKEYHKRALNKEVIKSLYSFII